MNVILDEPPLATLQTFQGLVRTMRLACPPGATVLDLGCGDGQYTIELARLGYKIVGIEARASRLQNAPQHPNLKYRHQDARNLDPDEQFDIVLCLGLLYHLDQPATYLHQLAQITHRLLLINTHYAERDDTSLPVHTHSLSRLAHHDGVPGRWYQEAPPGGWQNEQEMEAFSLSSWVNTRSFWIHKPALLQTLRQAGFPIVYEQFDTLERIDENPTFQEQHWRSTFAAIK
jgi:SAM-dependent methyltransferase